MRLVVVKNISERNMSYNSDNVALINSAVNYSLH